MANVFMRDLTSEKRQMDWLNGRFACTIGTDSWSLGCDGGEDITGVSDSFELCKRVINDHIFSLDSENMIVPIGGGWWIDLVVKRAFITTINPNPFHFHALARFYEFGVKDLDEISAPMLALIPIDKSLQKPDFIHYFGHFVSENDRLCCSVNSPHVRCCVNGVRFMFRGQQFLVYEYCEDIQATNRQLVVESEGSFKYGTFCECVRRILVVIGFFTGSYYFGPLWIFNTLSREFIAYNHSMPKGGFAKYHMWSLNPYEYLAEVDKSPESAEQIEHKLMPITRMQFEKLLALLDDKEFSYLFYIFQDVNLNTANLMASTKFPIYAACLEACKNRWIHVRPQHLTALYTEEQRTEITQKIKNILVGEYGDVKDTEVCVKKIGKIFQAANMDVLKEALEGVGVNLSEEERRALDWRNGILHGADIIKSSFDNNSPSKYINEIEYKLFMLHELIWRFIMKSIGYEGCYIDVAKINELFRESKSNDGQPLKREV